MTASAKTVPGTADHDTCMIAPTVPHRKAPRKGSGIRSNPPTRSGGTLSRQTVTGSLEGIIVSPLFRQATAALHCEKTYVGSPGHFGYRFLSPQPPGADRIGSVRTTRRANASWSFFVRVGMFFCLDRFCIAVLSPLILRSREAASRRIEAELPQQGLHGSRRR